MSTAFEDVACSLIWLIRLYALGPLEASALGGKTAHRKMVRGDEARGVGILEVDRLPCQIW